MNATGPLDCEPRLEMRAPDGRSVEKSYPIPPPRRIVSAASDARAMIDPGPSVKLSAIPPLTKQLAAVTCRGLPMADWMRPPGKNRCDIRTGRSK